MAGYLLLHYLTVNGDDDLALLTARKHYGYKERRGGFSETLTATYPDKKQRQPTGMRRCMLEAHTGRFPLVQGAR